ncbi:hypothetical protein BD626DRAFT_426383 [Schizophyllum amplum]|uniref:Bromo domain-containing protein n=1 Tax=Schizophyllum amplum TaxID=97359 RepID=A0A550CPS2_9AGAR|nr:hypothetical protein BD626DRAFT_426383 [Auriculariopsis ampla]
MDDFETYSYDYSEPGSSDGHQSPPPVPTQTLPKITLKLPPLKSVKPPKSHKKKSGKTAHASAPAYDYVSYTAPRQQRPVKLKPLKEVLSKLIGQIKKKDDYAFFLEPVNPALVPGYSDVVKQPMDLGTMSTKVDRGRYRSLEEFENDFKLVVGNAKRFNPPNTIYHTEAERIEAYGLDHISKASGTVVQYETDWNIDVEGEDEPHDGEEDDGGTAMDVDEPPPRRSSTPQIAASTSTSTRRGPRGPYKKSGSTAPQNTLDEDGRLPGAKDGLAAFPPGSDFAKLMLQLKLKNKRYKTKKERMRIEKEGLPVLPDGSLDYWEIEEPFYMLQTLVPDLLTRPQLIPLFPPVSSSYQVSQEARESSWDPNRAQSVQPQGQLVPSLPLPVALPTSHSPDIDVYEPPRVLGKRQHWTVTRNVSSRWRGDRDEDDNADEPPWKMPREAHTTDFGSLAVLASEIEGEMRRRNVQQNPWSDHSEEERLFLETLVDTLSPNPAKAIASMQYHDGSVRQPEDDERGPKMVRNHPVCFTPWLAAECEEYLRDVVYGGAAGYAYVRSLAQFASSSDILLDDEDSDEDCDTSDGKQYSSRGLGITLAQYIEREILDPCTDQRHQLVRRTGQLIATYPRACWASLMVHYNQRNTRGGVFDDEVVRQMGIALTAFPRASRTIDSLRVLYQGHLDVNVLVRAPEDLEACEREWEGAPAEEGQARQPKRLGEVVRYVMDKIGEVSKQLKEEAAERKLEGVKKEGQAPESISGAVKLEATTGRDALEEIPEVRNIRMNLLALAKRAPTGAQRPLNFTVPLSTIPATLTTTA